MQATSALPRIKKNLTPLPRTGTATPAHKARMAASLLFLSDGMTFGTWAALLPAFQQKFDLSPGKLSWVLLGMIAGAMISMPWAGKWISRHGSHRLASPAAVGFAATLFLLAWAPSFPWLIAVAVSFGLWKGALDVAINAQAITVEKALNRPINGSFQGFWSTGGLLASAVLGWLMQQHMPPTYLLCAMAIVLLVPAIGSFGKLLPDTAVTPTIVTETAGRRSAWLWWLGGLAFLALFSEGVMFDWSAVYIHTVGGLTVAQAPIGFTAFALCMAAARFGGDWLTQRVGAANTLRISGLTLAGGLAIAVLFPNPLAILTGFALVGFGTANTVPVIFSATGRLGHGTGTNLAAVTTMGYLGFLSGPPLIGFLAAWTNLPTALGLGILSGSIIAVAGAWIVNKTATAAK